MPIFCSLGKEDGNGFWEKLFVFLWDVFRKRKSASSPGDEQLPCMQKAN